MIESMISGGTNYIPMPVGQMTWTEPGTYQWVCPTGVTEVCALVVGSGTRGYTQGAWGYPGEGGEVRWTNKIPVQAGKSYSIVVGNAGNQEILTSTADIPYTGNSPSSAFGIVSSYSNQGGAIVRNANQGGGSGGASKYVGAGLGVGGNTGNIDSNGPAATTTVGSGGINLVTTAKVLSSDGRSGASVGGGGCAIPKAQNTGQTTLNKSWPGGHGGVRLIWGKGRGFPATRIADE